MDSRMNMVVMNRKVTNLLTLRLCRLWRLAAWYV